MVAILFSAAPKNGCWFWCLPVPKPSDSTSASYCRFRWTLFFIFCGFVWVSGTLLVGFKESAICLSFEIFLFFFMLIYNKYLANWRFLFLLIILLVVGIVLHPSIKILLLLGVLADQLFHMLLICVEILYWCVCVENLGFRPPNVKTIHSYLLYFCKCYRIR